MAMIKKVSKTPCEIAKKLYVNIKVIPPLDGFIIYANSFHLDSLEKIFSIKVNYFLKSNMKLLQPR